MAKAIVMNPPAELERRESDVPVPAERFLAFSLFARLAKKPTVEKFPGTLVLRRFRAGEVICRQGESGWTAFYVLTTEDMLKLRREQLKAAVSESDKTLWQREIAELEAAAQSAPETVAGKLRRRAATVYLAFARPARPGVRGLLSRVAAAFGKGRAPRPERRPLFIPIDAPTDVSYDNRLAALYEGDLFGEQSCLYGTPRSATIVADRDCYVLEMLRNILDQIQGDKAYRAEMDAVYKDRILKSHLRNLSLFSDLTDEQFAQIQDSVDLIRKKDGQVLYDEHDRSDGMYIIRSGLVKVMKNVSSLLTPEDVRDWPKLLAFIGSEPAHQSAAVRHLHQLLPESLRNGATEERKIEVIDALNEIIKHPQLPEAAPIQELCTTPALAEFIRSLPAKRGEWSELNRRRFNRLLVEAACPGVLRSRQRPVGPEMVLAYLGRGEFLGEMGLLADQPRSATCLAYVHPRREEDGQAAEKWRRETEHVELVYIPAAAFRELMTANPTLRARVEQVVARRKRLDEERVSVPIWDDRKEILLSGEAANLGLVVGQKLMLIDLDRCTRCDECVQACVDTHTDGRTRLYLDGPRFGKYLVPTTCRACLDPVCMIGCPVGSIHRGDNRQMVIEDWCIGCGLCATNCPYGSIQMHDIGIIAESTHGWRYAPEKGAGKNWQSRRYNDAQWLIGRSPFADNRELREKLDVFGFQSGDAVCFRYEFRLEANLLRNAVRFKLEVTSADEEATVWINGHEIARPAEKPKRGKREYLLSRDMNLLRAGRNVLAVKVTPPPPVAGKPAVLLELRLDEVPMPNVPVDMRESVEISEKLVTELAVVCDQCSSQVGQRPACVTACPHDAAMRVDARFNFPVA